MPDNSICAGSGDPNDLNILHTDLLFLLKFTLFPLLILSGEYNFLQGHCSANMFQHLHNNFIFVSF